FLQAGIHIAKLTDQTQQHPMIQSAENKPGFGYTLGMANLLQAKKIFLLVSGEHKKGQLKRLLERKMDTEFPASFLWLHPDVHLFSDLELL
ncbi:MAG: 6-phosphogluconolactonase, partial [Candidatus Obscuribacterales bacterium]|nr:6-phosphogluconolactonase [Candidatus Obscuribacterales bacterium]